MPVFGFIIFIKKGEEYEFSNLDFPKRLRMACNLRTGFSPQPSLINGPNFCNFNLVTRWQLDSCYVLSYQDFDPSSCELLWCNDIMICFAS
jgi:hypothetical protein